MSSLSVARKPPFNSIARFVHYLLWSVVRICSFVCRGWEGGRLHSTAPRCGALSQLYRNMWLKTSLRRVLISLANGRTDDILNNDHCFYCLPQKIHLVRQCIQKAWAKVIIYIYLSDRMPFVQMSIQYDDQLFCMMACLRHLYLP